MHTVSAIDGALGYQQRVSARCPAQVGQHLSLVEAVKTPNQAMNHDRRREGCGKVAIRLLRLWQLFGGSSALKPHPWGFAYRPCSPQGYADEVMGDVRPSTYRRLGTETPVQERGLSWRILISTNAKSVEQSTAESSVRTCVRTAGRRAYDGDSDGRRSGLSSWWLEWSRSSFNDPKSRHAEQTVAR